MAGRSDEASDCSCAELFERRGYVIDEALQVRDDLVVPVESPAQLSLVAEEGDSVVSIDIHSEAPGDTVIIGRGPYEIVNEGGSLTGTVVSKSSGSTNGLRTPRSMPILRRLVLCRRRTV